MPTVSFDYNDFINLLGHKIPIDKLLDRLPMIGADLDKVDGDEISIEFFPDRPDLASVEGIARASRAFFGFETGLKKYDVKISDIIMNVDESVKKVRPFVVTALVRNVNMSDELISSLMELQEKLHMGIGRNRKKVAIGVHNFEPVQPPFTYKTVDPDAVEFIPLNKFDVSLIPGEPAKLNYFYDNPDEISEWFLHKYRALFYDRFLLLETWKNKK